MKIEKMTIEKGEALALTLVDTRELEGRYFVIPRKEDPTRYMLVPGDSGTGIYTATTGYDPHRKQWVTLCRGDAEAIVMLGETTKPLV